MRRLALLAVALLAVGAPTAAAQETNAPPGNSGIDQYLESVPSASGNTPSTGVAADKAKPSPAVVEALRNRGKTGAELERLVASSSPAGNSKPKASADHSGSQARTPPPPAAQASPPVRSAVAAATGSGGGIGVWLAVLLGAVALSAVGLLVVRRARGRQTPS